METTKSRIGGHGQEIIYKLVGRTYYHQETPDQICNIIENAANSSSRQKLKFHFGDVETGKDWNDEHDTIGFIGRSTGVIPVPLLIKTKYSSGGGAILDHCVVKIVDFKTKVVLYKHPNYIPPVVNIVNSTEAGYSHALEVNGTLYSNHKTLLSAKRLQQRLLL